MSLGKLAVVVLALGLAFASLVGAVTGLGMGTNAAADTGRATQDVDVRKNENDDDIALVDDDDDDDRGDDDTRLTGDTRGADLSRSRDQTLTRGAKAANGADTKATGDTRGFDPTKSRDDTLTRGAKPANAPDTHATGDTVGADPTKSRDNSGTRGARPAVSATGGGDTGGVRVVPAPQPAGDDSFDGDSGGSVSGDSASGGDDT